MIKKLAGVLVAAGVLLTFVAPAAQAAPPEPFTLKDINFNTGEVSFTATGALCPSGTFARTRETFAGSENNSRFNILISWHLCLHQRRHLLRPKARAHCDQ
jgi:hypothetical protein